MLNMIPIASSNIEAAGYDDEAQEMVVAFKGGSTYRYADVPRSVFAALTSAPSPGSYFARFVRGRFTYSQEGGSDA